jgi:hypothetical protein
VAATGGALLLGAARRLFDQVRARDAVLLVIGLAILATSRPYEGMLVALPVALLLTAGLLRRKLRPTPWLRFVLPAGVLLLAAAAGIAGMNRAITGDPLEFPHSLYDRTHGVPPVFLWEPLATAEASSDAAQSAGSWREPRTSGWHRMAVTLHFFVGVTGVLALLLTPALLRDAWSRFAALAFLAVSVGHFLIYPWWAHYSAPALAAILAPTVQGFRHVYAARRSTPHGPRAFGRALFGAACAIPVALFLFQLPAHRADATDPSRQRARLAWELEHREGRHLLLVRYPPAWNPDWTYNPADVDAAKVVWATDLGEAVNAELLRYYADRTVWHVDAAFTATDPVLRLVRPADPGAGELRPYPAQ